MDVRLSTAVVYLFPENGGAENGDRSASQPSPGKTPAFKLVLKNNSLFPVQVVGIISTPVPCVYFPSLENSTKKAERRTGQHHSSGMIQIAPGEIRQLEGRFHLTKVRQAMRTPGPGTQTSAPRENPALPPTHESLRQASPASDWKNEREAEPAEEEALPKDTGEGGVETHWRALQLELQVQLSPAWPAPACELTVLPPPEFELLTPALHLLPAQEAEAGTTKCAPAAILRLRQGAARISELKSAQSGIHFDLASHDGFPVDLQADDENNELRFHVEVANEVIAACRKNRRPLPVDLKIICAAPSGVFRPRRASLKIVPRLLAQLAFPDFNYSPSGGPPELKTWALAGRVRNLPVRVQNASDQALEIYAVEATRELAQLVRKSPALPLRLAPQETTTFHFMLDMRAVESAATCAGMVALRFRTEENAGVFAAQFALHVETRTPSAFKGAAAMDFGASDSCLAVMEEGDNEKASARLLEIRGEALARTVLVYHHAGKELERSYEIGREAVSAKEPGQARPKLSWRFVEDLKKSLQHEQLRPVLTAQAAPPIMLTNDAIVEDYLRAFLHAAEERLAEEIFQRGQRQQEADFGACLLREILIACPATFTFQQKQTLRQALAELGMNVRADSFQSAAAMACFSELGKIFSLGEGGSPNAAAGSQGRSGTAPVRHVLAYDSGAAFTDMALVRLDFAATAVEKITESDAVSVGMKILGLDGDDQFGGQNVTAAVAKHLAQQVVAQLEGKLKTRVQLPLWHRTGTIPAKAIEQIGYLNWKHLWHHAEQAKRRLSVNPSLAESTTPRMALRIIVNKKLQAAVIAPVQIKAVFLEKVIAARLELHLRKMQRLIQQAGLDAPDLIYLSGRSTVLPAVRKMISRTFNSRVVFAGALQSSQDLSTAKLTPLQFLKASVALGGAQYLRLLRNGGIFFRSSK
jgi:molecular chaperone DnaK (HSP70)